MRIRGTERSKYLAWLLGAGVVAVIVIGVVLFGSSESPNVQSPAATSTVQTTETDPTVNWQSYTSEVYGYTLKYPNDWFNLPGGGAPESDKYFANEQVGAPLEGSPHLAYLTIRVSQGGDLNGCYNVGNSQTVDQADITIDGTPAKKYITAPAPDAQTSNYNIVYSTSYQGQCYNLTFLLKSAAARDTNAATAEMIVSTFRFKN